MARERINGIIVTNATLMDACINKALSTKKNAPAVQLFKKLIKGLLDG